MEEIIKNNLIQDYLKDNYEKQGRWYSKNKPLSAAQIPQWWIDWKDNNFVIYKFTGKFRKIKTAEFCKNVAGRNRRKCFAYRAEFVDADGNKFPFLGLYKHATKEFLTPKE